MESRILGIILSIVGILGLVLALIYVNVAASPKNVEVLFGCGILATGTFFWGIRLLPNKRADDNTVKVRS
jgi:hypothetical protein